MKLKEKEIMEFVKNKDGTFISLERKKTKIDGIIIFLIFVKMDILI